MFRARELKQFGSALIRCQAQKVPIKIQQRHHLRDNSLLNFNFVAVSLLACTPVGLHKSLQGIEPLQDTDIYILCFFIMFFHQQDNFYNILLTSHFHCVLYTIGHCGTFQHATYSTVRLHDLISRFSFSCYMNLMHLSKFKFIPQ